MAPDRYYAPEEFVTLYLRYRLDDMIAFETRLAQRSQRRNVLTQFLLISSLLLATVCGVLSGLPSALTVYWAVIGALFVAVALALGAGMIAFGLGRQANLHRATARSLNQMRARKPGSIASRADVERWIWQTESIMSSARSDVEPLLGGPAPVPN